jgi:hypothetical protein
MPIKNSQNLKHLPFAYSFRIKMNLKIKFLMSFGGFLILSIWTCRILEMIGCFLVCYFFFLNKTNLMLLFVIETNILQVWVHNYFKLYEYHFVWRGSLNSSYIPNHVRTYFSHDSWFFICVHQTVIVRQTFEHLK